MPEKPRPPRGVRRVGTRPTQRGALRPASRPRRRGAGGLAPGGDRPRRGGLAVAVLLGALGFALSTTTLDGQRDAGRELTEAQLVELLHDVEIHDDDLDAQRAELQEQKQALEEGRGSSEAERQARERTEAMGILAGTTPAAGPGIRMTIPGARDLGAMSLLDAVQELRDAGAEAIEVNDHRVVASTWFSDGTDGEVIVDGEPIRAPYRIEAVGEGQTMATAMGIPGGVVESAQQKGSDVDVLVLDEVRVESVVPTRG